MPVLFAFSIGGVWVIFSGFVAVGTFFGILCGNEPKPFFPRLLFAILCYALVATVFWGFGDLVFGRTLLFQTQILDS